MNFEEEGDLPKPLVLECQNANLKLVVRKVSSK